MTNLDQVLDTPSVITDGTVRDMLAELLTKVWEEAEGFSGKRPFGNSDWQTVVYGQLVKAGLLEGELDEDGYLESVDYGAGEELVVAAIKHAFAQPAEGSYIDVRFRFDKIEEVDYTDYDLKSVERIGTNIPQDEFLGIGETLGQSDRWHISGVNATLDAMVGSAALYEVGNPW